MARDPEENKARYEAEIAAGAKIGHTQKITGVTLDDTCHCSCGWKSNTYQDGREWAFTEWVEHIKKQGAKINYKQEERKCA